MSRALITALFSLSMFAACGGKKDEGKKDDNAKKDDTKRDDTKKSVYLDKLKQNADKVCACANMGCASKAMDDFKKESEELAKANPSAKMSEEDLAAANTVTTKLSDCMKKLTSAVAGDAPTDKDAKDPKDTKDGEDTELQKKALEFMGKMADVQVANEKDCKKMAAEITKLIADNKKLVEEVVASEKKDKDALKAFEKRHEADLKELGKKMQGPQEKCGDDQAFKTAISPLAHD